MLEGLGSVFGLGSVSWARRDLKSEMQGAEGCEYQSCH